jgi:transcriptional regulator with XRE-family HTH domain
MAFKEFGELVRSLRKQRLFDTGTDLQQWTQTHLAKIASETSEQKVTFANIAMLERGKIKDITPFLEPLAKAFELNAGEKERFYAMAGLIYRNERVPDRNEIGELFRLIQYPAFARTPWWDFIAFNRYNYILWGYTPEKLAKLKSVPVGANLLKVLFDPDFESEVYKGGYERWAADIRRSIQAFRFESFSSVSTDRYRQIIGGMQRYHAFVSRWNAHEPSFRDHNLKPTRPISSVFHPQYGALEFLSLRTPTKYLGSVVDISIYIPLASSIERYKQLQEDAQKRTDIESVFFF